jgi:tRNA pseudouridine55 synthase
MEANEFDQGKVLLFDKPYRWTSFDVVRKIRNATRAKKVGHAGTLDPLATGLLIVCTGKFTKQIDSYQAQEKEYTGTFRLGATTSSHDLETAITQTFDISGITEAMVIAATENFKGEIMQRPPLHSAVNVNGERAYEKARRGEVLELQAKKVTITAFDITSIQWPDVHFRIVCSKGTYIRSLASDFGKSLNNGAHLTTLCRTRIGEFKLADALSVTDFIAQKVIG